MADATTEDDMARLTFYTVPCRQGHVVIGRVVANIAEHSSMYAQTPDTQLETPEGYGWIRREGKGRKGKGRKGGRKEGYNGDFFAAQ